MNYDNLVLFEKWDNILDKYICPMDEKNDSHGSFESSMFLSKLILDKIKLSKDSVIVDIGCGNGVFTDICSEYSGFVFGIDSDFEKLELAKTRDVDKKIKYINGSFESLNFDNKADFVVSSLVFHKVNFDDKLNALKNIKRILKDDGEFILCDMLIMYDPYDDPKLFDKCYRYLLENTTPKNLYRKNIEPYLETNRVYTYDDMKRFTPKEFWFYNIKLLNDLLDSIDMKILESFSICDFFGILKIVNK